MGKTYNTTIVNNHYNVNNTGIRPDYFNGLKPNSFRCINHDFARYCDKMSKYFDRLSQGGGQQNILPGGCVRPPRPSDCCHPQGSMKADGNTITTPGGYKIEATGQFEWKITGPDGKSTRVWGDPHVAEGDGGKWDFKRNSTFVLGDGTKINVTTAPWGKGGMTVTSGLEVINGNERVTVSGIDKGKGVVGNVTQDGFEHTNTFQGNDVFVMGKETDDWAHQGREIIGSNNGGDSFKLGKELAPGNRNDERRYQPYPPFNNDFNNRNYNDFNQMLRSFVDDLCGNSRTPWRENRIGENPYRDGLNNRNDYWGGGRERYDDCRHKDTMRDCFRLISDLFSLLSRYSGMNDQMFANRNRYMTA